MRISLKKIVPDIRGLAEEYPEPYVYSVILEASNAVAAHAVAADPSLREKFGQYQDQTNKYLERIENEPIEDVKKGFFFHIQKPWNMINTAAKKQPKEDRREFLRGSTTFFWNAMAEEDKKAKAHSEGRRYGAFWIPFLVGATAFGGIFAYSSGKASKEYIEEKEKTVSPIVYAGIGAAAVLGVTMMMKR
jgi:hypothetical protein